MSVLSVDRPLDHRVRTFLRYLVTPRVVSAASVLLLILTLGVVMFAAVRLPMKDDLAWLMYMAREWLSGHHLYTDLVEVNPPLIIWLSAIPALLSRWLDADPKSMALPFFTVCVLAPAWWSASILREQGRLFGERLFENRLAVFCLTGTVLLAIAGPELGQREHLLVASMLPYLCLFAGELRGVRSRVWVAIGAGLLAGLGAALKPRYVVVFMLLEGLALVYGRRPWRTLPITTALTLGVYAAIVVLIYPDYLAHAVPMALALYGATDVPFSYILGDNALVMLGEACVITLALLYRRQLPQASMVLAFGLFAAGSTLVCFLDGKNWFYHRLPATIVTVLALLVWAAGVLSDPATRKRRVLLPLVAAGVVGAVFAGAAVQRMTPQMELAYEPDNSTVVRLEHIIRRERAHSYVAFSEWIALGFPVVNNTGVVWASRFDSMWALKGELWRARFDPTTQRSWPISRWVSRDFIAGCPDLVVVDTREGVNYVAVLSASDPAFAAAWRHYRQITSFDGLRVFKHQGTSRCFAGNGKLMEAESYPSDFAHPMP